MPKGRGTPGSKPSRTAEQRKQHIERILEEIKKHKEHAEREKLSFTGLTREEIEKKLSRTRTPTVIFQSWNSAASAGGTINYTIGIYNPDPVDAIWLFGHVFVGPANAVNDIASALLAVDPRFPRLSMPAFAGLTITPGATATLSYAIQVPASIEASNYMGNCFVFRENWHDVGTYIDRGGFIFAVN
jgi:hypothetical protein